MKIRLIALIILFVIFVCGCSSRTSNQLNNVSTTSTGITSKLLNASEQREHIKKSLNKISKDEATDLVITLVKTQESECETYNDIMSGELFDQLTNKDFKFLDEVRKSKDKEYQALREFIQDVDENGYEINFYEGYYPVVDFSYESIYKEFNECISKEYADYFQIRYLKSPYGAEGMLTASLEELEEMLEDTYKFNTDYPRSPYKEEVMDIYHNYLTLYFNPDAGEGHYIEERDITIFSPKHIESFKSIIKKHNGSELGDLVSEYLNLLEKNNFEYSDTIKDFITNKYE